MVDWRSVELILVSLMGGGSDFVLFVVYPCYLIANADGSKCKWWLRLVVYSGLKCWVKVSRRTP